MAKKKGKKSDVTLPLDILGQAQWHYKLWTQDRDQRMLRKNGWNDITDAYWGKLPDDWPYSSKVIDPRIRTTVIEKDSRLLNAKLRGRLVPREGGDILKAKINNAVLDFQWDSADEGGTMLSKWLQMSQDTRLYASSFGLVKWKYECDDDGEVLFNGNEFKPLDVRNVGIDPNCDNVRNASWVQVTEWAKIEDLEANNDTPSGEPLYPGLQELLDKVNNYPRDRRDTRYANRTLNLKGLTDRVGDDRSYPTLEIVTEYRKDRWITFAPRHNVILRDIENPYEHGLIPVVQLRYYTLTGDPLGESEIEPVLPLWRAIQANLCGYLDNLNVHNRPPLKILDGAVRIETIVFGPEAQWLVDRVDAVTEFQGSDAPMQLFQTAHSALVAAFNTAMGDASQGVSNVDPFGGSDKTATEIRYSSNQQNSRDQRNQNALADALEDMMKMWVSNNKQFLFTDPNEQEYVLRILGGDLFKYFQQSGLDGMEVTPQAMQTIADIVGQQGGNVSDEDLQTLHDAGKTPIHPIFKNPNEKDPEKLQMKTKMQVSDTGDSAEVYVVPDDLEGDYDYIADVKSMASGADTEQQQGLQAAVDSVTQNPLVGQMLMAEGFQPKIKDLLVANFENKGLSDAERFFQPMQPAQGQGGQPQQGQPTGQGQPQQAQDPSQAGAITIKPPNQIVNYKDAPEDIKRQMEQADGYEPSQLPPVVQQPQPAQQMPVANQPQM